MKIHFLHRFPKTKFEIWLHNQMAAFHNRGLKLKDPLKRQYYNGRANGLAHALDKVLNDRYKVELKARAKHRTTTA